MKPLIKGDVNNIMANKMKQAGIDPKTRLPYKIINELELKCEIKKRLRIRDEQDAINRYRWFNLPDITSQELERLIYYKGQIVMFYYEPLDRFMYLPFCLNGTIDFYGRYNQVRAIPLTSGNQGIEEALKNPQYKNQYDLLSQYPLYPLYTIPNEPLSYEQIIHSCVIIRDYTPQIGQEIISNSLLQEAIVDYMSDIIPFSRTALMNSTGVTAERVPDDDCAGQVALLNDTLYTAALKGQRLVAAIGQLEFQDLAPGQVAKAEEFWMSFQSMDTFRRSSYGLGDGSLFEKKAHMLESEMSINTGIAQTPLVDGLTQRQTACDIMNAIMPIGFSCEISETASETDKNGDGMADDSQDQSGIQGEQAKQAEVSDNV